MRYEGHKTTEEYAACPLCGYSNFLVRVGFMKWDHERCLVC